MRARSGLGWRRMCWLVAGAVHLAVAAAARAQGAGTRGTVQGGVTDETGRGLAGARVALVGDSVGTESDDMGGFRLPPTPVGARRLVARRIGFAPETVAVVVAPGANRITVGLRRLALPLDAVLVQGRRDLRGPMAGFYARKERGNGHFFTLEQIERRNVRRMSDLLRGIPGLRVEQRRFGVQTYRIRGSSAAPLVWLDGVPMGAGEVDLDVFDPTTFAGIEVYSGAATVPIEFAGSRIMSTSGGSIVLWTRQGRAGPPRRRKGEPTPAARVAQMLERGEAFPAAGVDSPARPIGVEPMLPLYPDSLYEARQPGYVEVEFVVDATGHVLMETFGVVATTHRSLGEAVRRALQDRTFVPAIRGGVRVSQLFQLPFEFRPDSGVVVRKRDD